MRSSPTLRLKQTFVFKEMLPLKLHNGATAARKMLRRFAPGLDMWSEGNARAQITLGLDDELSHTARLFGRLRKSGDCKGALQDWK